MALVSVSEGGGEGREGGGGGGQGEGEGGWREGEKVEEQEVEERGD